MKYHDTDAYKARLEAIEQMDQSKLAELISASPQCGPQEIADLLTFLPPEQRLPTVMAFVNYMLLQ